MRFPIRRVEKPWGYELIFAHTDRYVGKILHVNAGQALSLQYHEIKDETLYLSEGEVELVVEEEGDAGQPGLCGAAIPTGSCPSRGTAWSPATDGCDIIEVSTPELDDVVRLEDRYGRT